MRIFLALYCGVSLLFLEGQGVKFFRSSVFLRSARALASMLFVLTSSAQAQVLELPATGVWNGFNSQVNILECNNTGDVGYESVLTIFNNQGQTIGSRILHFAPYATVHLPFSDFQIQNAYGTYVISHSSGNYQADSPLNCSMIFYRFAAAGATKALEYAFAIPLTGNSQGITSGVFNSYSPAGDNRAVENWFTIFNPGQETFAAQVEVYNQDGSYNPQASFPILGLQPGERRDVPLGHDRGQVVGIYRVVPFDLEAKYGAFVSRYSRRDNFSFRFAFPLFSQAGTCDSGPIPASTMDPALNWGEVANPTPEGISFFVEIRDAFGTVRYADQQYVPAFSQRHFFINQYLGARQVGTFRVSCARNDLPLQRLLVQSVFYGQRAEAANLIEWAYVSQSRNLLADEGSTLAFSVNTFLGAANWNKFLDASHQSTQLTLSLEDMSGSTVKRFSRQLSSGGGLDVPLHEEVGSNFAGLALARSYTETAQYGGECVRVFPDARGGVGTIFNIVPRVVPAGAKDRGQVRLAQGGHFLEFRGKRVMLVGNSITQGWMELGDDFHVTEYLDLLQANRINTLMLWSYIGIQDQKADSRIGYDAPRLWPWVELSGRKTPPYNFQFVDGAAQAQFNEHYFTKLRELIDAANARDIIVLLTVHDGWTKSRFSGHPFNLQNGGTLALNSDYVSLADYNNEMPVTYNSGWTAQQKHQFYLERFADKLIRATGDFPNVMYEIFNEGEWYDQTKLRPFEVHFLDFFRARTEAPLVVNDDGVGGQDFFQESNVDFLSFHQPNWNLHSAAGHAFNFFSPLFNSGNPLKRPLLFDEPVPEYVGGSAERDALMRLMWGTYLGGANFFLQNDVDWKYPNVAVDPFYAVLSGAGKLLHDNDIHFWEMTPQGNLCSPHVCFANVGKEYLVYTQAAPFITMDLSSPTEDLSSRLFTVRYLNPKDGTFDVNIIYQLGGSATTVIPKPNDRDWVIWIKAN